MVPFFSGWWWPKDNCDKFQDPLLEKNRIGALTEKENEFYWTTGFFYEVCHEII